MHPLRALDDLLNKITAHRLLLYGLSILAGLSIIFAALRILPLPWLDMLVTLVILGGACYFFNQLFVWFFQAPASAGSPLITALILFFLLPQIQSAIYLLALPLAALLAIGSKYIIAYHHKHLFNPAAFAAVALGLIGVIPVTWWVGNTIMLPFTACLGLLVLRKLHRFQLFFTFILTALAVMVIIALVHNAPTGEMIISVFTSWPLVFFGAIMLIEPSTLPPRRYQHLVYGALTGGLFASQWHIGPLYSSPAVALLLGNLYAYIASPKFRLALRLTHKTQLPGQAYSFRFEPSHDLAYLPGQHLEWTLPHTGTDARGNRRTFTLASSPTEPELLIGVKFSKHTSSFKTALAQLEAGEIITAGQLAGDFVLPENPAQPLGFIASGIGITPFRSMLKYLIDTGEKRDITLFYNVDEPGEVSFQDVLDAARARGVKITLLLASSDPAPKWKGETGPLTPDIIRRDALDPTDRRWYVSGPPAMVRHYRSLLGQMGVKSRHIITDSFDGY